MPGAGQGVWVQHAWIGARDPGSVEGDSAGEEVSLMAHHGVLPHVVVVLAEPFWRTACASLGEPPAGLRVHEHVSTGTAGFEKTASWHHVNRYIVEGRDGVQPLVLLRLFHPAAQKPSDETGLPRGTVRWLLAQPDFRAVVGLPG